MSDWLQYHYITTGAVWGHWQLRWTHVWVHVWGSESNHKHVYHQEESNKEGEEMSKLRPVSEDERMEGRKGRSQRDELNFSSLRNWNQIFFSLLGHSQLSTLRPAHNKLKRCLSGNYTDQPHNKAESGVCVFVKFKMFNSLLHISFINLCFLTILYIFY